MNSQATLSTQPQHLVVGWTGHRQLQAPEQVAIAITATFERLASHAADCGRTLVCVGSAAIGADLLFCEEAIRRSIPLIVVLPYAPERFEIAADENARARIIRVLAQTNAVDVVHALEAGDEAGYLEAGLRTVNDCDVLLAVWDRVPPEDPAGTAAIVTYARELERPIACIDPGTGAVEWLRELPAGRSAKAPDPEAAPLCKADVVRLFTRLDAAANRHARPRRSLLFTIIWLHLLASAIVVVAQTAYPELLRLGGTASLVAHPILTGASILKILALLFAIWLASRYRQPHRNWMDHRVRAELCRALLAVWHLPRWAVRAPIAPITSLTSLQRDLYVAWQLDAPRTFELDSARHAYLYPGEQTADATGRGRIAAQLDYLRTHATATGSRNHQLHGIATASTLAAIGFSIAALALNPFGEEFALSAGMLKSLGVLLPLVSAALLTYATAGDLKRRSERYRELADRLAELQQRIRSARSWYDLGRSIDLTEQLLLAEVAEWHAFNRFAGQPH